MQTLPKPKPMPRLLMTMHGSRGLSLMLVAAIVLLCTEVATVIGLSSITAAATIAHLLVEVIHQDSREATTTVIPPVEVHLTAPQLQIIGMVIKILLK